MLSRHVQRAALVVGAIAAALMFFVAGAALRLLMGPISLGPFAGAIEDSLNRSITGLTVRFDEAVLEWSRHDGKINLVVLGTKVFDTNGRIVAQAPKADLDFGVADLLAGNLSVKRFALVGVQLTAVRSADGELRLGFGIDRTSSDLLDTIRMILQDSGRSGGSLETFSIVNARLAFEDEGSGLFVVFPDAHFTVRNQNQRLDASLESAIEISGYPAQVMLTAVLRDDGTPEEAMLEVKGLSFPALTKNSANFAYLEPYRLTSDVTTSFVFGANNEIRTAEFRVTGKGAIETSAMSAPIEITAFDAEGKFDTVYNSLTLDRVSFASKELTAKANAGLVLVWNDSKLATVSGHANILDAQVDTPKFFREKLNFPRIQLSGIFDPNAKKMAFQRAHIEGDALTADFVGALTFVKDVAPAVQLSGTLNPIGVRDILKYWPANKADGAYGWIYDNVPEGRSGTIQVELNTKPGDFDAETLPDEAVRVSFPVEGLTAHYIQGMTPLTNARGDAVLTGDTFNATILSGSVGPLPVTNGSFVIDALHIHGAPGLIKAHTEGSVTDVLTLIDQQPLGYAKKFNIVPADAKGSAVVDLEVGLPMLRDLPMEQVRVGVEAKIAELSVPIDPKRRLEHAAVNFSVTTASLVSQGRGTISGAPVTFKWAEDFRSEGNSSRIDLTGRLNDVTRASLGLTEPAWITGAMPVTAIFTGRRFHFTEATVKADLTAAKMFFPIMNIDKRPGLAATASGTLAFRDGGAIGISDIVMTAEALDLRGGLQIDGTGRLVNVVLNQVHAGKGNDFALNLTPLVSGGYDIRIKGKSLDATRFFTDDKKEPKEAVPESEADSTLRNPLVLNVDVERMLFKDDITFKNASLAVAFGANERLNNLRLDAEGPLKGKITAGFAVDKGIRKVTVDAEDAEGFVRAFTGFSSIRGGALSARIAFPADDPQAKQGNADYTGTLTLEDFVVTDQPFLARLFAAGSLDGPLRLMQGSGISISNFSAPFSARGKMMTINGGRAAGTAIGATFEGTLDRRQDRIDLTGTLVPAYAFNSLLGNVPVLGDLLVSKPGEGIIGLTYAMKGNLGEPALTVNPLSVLTPGIFRRLFEFSPTKPAPEAPPPQASIAPLPAAPEAPN
ncbi:MAG: DUF3971 domain-containing protein [Alphaproteobacteria bacterium]|nr:DUF3971 domain-containing protein [Alphaproteobacteria bacterium]